MKKKRKFYIGQKVRWNDPGINDYEPEDRAEVLGRVFIITDLNKETGYAYICEQDGPSEAEVWTSELEPADRLELHTVTGMNSEDKELLLKDLCARLPYGVKCKITAIKKEEIKTLFPEQVGVFRRNHCKIYPYLRPMSSMTSEEWIEYCDCCSEDEKDVIISKQTRYRIIPTTHREHFFNSHHFDYKGLIEKGLALKATEGMYN